MFCPKCKAEYREGFYRCADCDCDLVYELPAQEDGSSQREIPGEGPIVGKFIKLLRVSNEGEVAFLKSLLNTTDIPYYFKSRLIRMSVPEQPPADLMVERARIEEARELLKDFREEKEGGA
jgi:hypothetical protein